MSETQAPCPICLDQGWVCEDHPNQGWDRHHQQNCGAGKPCQCNKAEPPWNYPERPYSCAPEVKREEGV